MKKRSKKEKKKGIIALSIILIVFIALAIVYYLHNLKLKEIEANRLKYTIKEDTSTEINSEVHLKDYLNEVINGELINGDDLVDTSKLGEITLDLIFNNKDNIKEKYPITIKVIDTTKPIIEAKKEISSYVSNNVNLLNGVKVSDNSKEDIKAKVIGEYDINKAGKYNLKYEAIDSSNNKAEYDFILNIVSDPNNRTFTTSKGYTGKVVNGVTYIDGVLIANKTYSLPSSYAPGLTSETQNAFYKMQADAKNLGLNLVLSSGYRSYWDQKIIYNGYVSRDGQVAADTYSARPGHSEHQTGLTFDLNSIDDSFSYTEEGKWIHNNCYKYGFILRYPKGKESITGYMYESWHMRYVGVNLATKLYNDGDWITLEEYFGIDSKYS